MQDKAILKNVRFSMFVSLAKNVRFSNNVCSLVCILQFQINLNNFKTGYFLGVPKPYII